MSIKEFQKHLIKELLKRLDGDYYINKNNYDLIIGKKNSPIESSFCIEKYFMLYQNVNNLELILSNIIAFEEKIQKINLMNYAEIKNALFFRLVNTQTNTKWLQLVPSISFLDLSIVFYIEIQTEIGEGTILIKNDFLSILKIPKEQLYQDALNNLQTFKPDRTINLFDAIAQEIESDSIFEKTVDLLILTNTCNKYGASCMLYPNTLKKIAEKQKKDIFILPSSIHETILVPTSANINICELAKIVHTVNTEDVLPEERLSSHIYKYSIKYDTISIAY